MSVIFTVFTALFSVVNPLGAVPLFTTLTQGNTLPQRNRQALKASIYAFAILTVFLLAGNYILNFFGITIEGMKIAGGIIIMQSGFSLMGSNFRKRKSISPKVEAEAMISEDISFSPLAMPMLAGPGSISLLISFSVEYTSLLSYANIVIAIAMLAVACYVILRFAPMLLDKLGRSGIVALSRIMGFIVLTIGIQFIINGILPLLNQIFGSK